MKVKDIQKDFIDGRITAQEYKRETIRRGIFSGLFYGLFMGALFFIADKNFDRALAGCLFSGGFFGVALTWWMLRIVNKTIRVFANQFSNSMAKIRGDCPVCSSKEKRLLTWKNPLMLHWMINPVFAVNELVFGQRVPNEIYRCENCGNYYLYCKNCKHYFNEMKMEAKGLFRRSGYTCPECNHVIPSLRNGLAWVIIIVITPLWWPVQKIVQRRYESMMEK